MRIDKRFWCYAVSATVVIFLTAQIILAEPRSSDSHQGVHSAAGEAQLTEEFSSTQLSQYAPDNQPFTPAWYRDHPQAWQMRRPGVNVWQVASFDSVANWLGWGAVAPAPYQRSLVFEPASGISSDLQQVETAGDLVHQGDLDPSAPSGEWLPLGVFALLPADRNHADHLMQLAINQDGAISGLYYDVLSDTKQPLYGSVDLQTQRVAWTVGSGDGVLFETVLASLTEEQGLVWLHFGNGRTQRWMLHRQVPPERVR